MPHPDNVLATALLLMTPEERAEREAAQKRFMDGMRRLLPAGDQFADPSHGIVKSMPSQS